MIQLDPPLKTQLEKVDRGTELLNFLSNHSKLNLGSQFPSELDLP